MAGRRERPPRRDTVSGTRGPSAVVTAQGAQWRRGAGARHLISGQISTVKTVNQEMWLTWNDHSKSHGERQEQRKLAMHAEVVLPEQRPALNALRLRNNGIVRSSGRKLTGIQERARPRPERSLQAPQQKHRGGLGLLTLGEGLGTGCDLMMPFNTTTADHGQTHQRQGPAWGGGRPLAQGSASCLIIPLLNLGGSSRSNPSRGEETVN